MPAVRRRQRSAGLSIAVVSLAAAACLESPPSGGDDDPATCPGNLVANGSFEDGTAGWLVAFGTVELVADAYEGELAAEVCADGTSDEEGYYSLDDAPPSVPEPGTGERYELVVWIRALNQIEPQDIEVAVREYDAAGQPRPSQTLVSPDARWRQVSAFLIVESAEPRNVDVYVAGTDPRVGNCFQVDSVCLTRGE